MGGVPRRLLRRRYRPTERIALPVPTPAQWIPHRTTAAGSTGVWISGEFTHSRIHAMGRLAPAGVEPARFHLHRLFRNVGPRPAAPRNHIEPVPNLGATLLRYQP